jgi:polyisoprenoid-binding protein YceI
MKNREFKIIATQSNIDWTGRKVTGSHNGTIALKEGSLVLDGNRLLNGRFVVDTTSIKVLDITDPATNAQFAGHLASNDFFGSEKYPEALFVINSAELVEENTYRINGDLTIKEITQPIVFNAILYIKEGILSATGRIHVDRTRYNMKFRSGNFFQNLGDNLIYNDFELAVTVVAKEVTELVIA